MGELHWASATELARSLETNEVSSVEITQSLIDRAEAIEGELQAYLLPTADRALADAGAADERRSAGKALSAYDGIPIAYKDLFVTKGITSTSGSKILAGYVPPYDATVVARCSQAGLPLLGKLNMDEFAMGSSGENSGYQLTKNP